MSNVKRNVKAIFFCLLSMAVSAFCVYQIILSKDYEASLHLHITDNTTLNNMIDTVIKFDEKLQCWYLIGLGLLALIFDNVFSESMNEFFSRLPLGSIKEYDYFKIRKGVFKRSATVLSPALIIGFYVVVHLIFNYFFPDYLDICIKWILPIAMISTLIAVFALAVSIFIDGGLWGVIVRLPLLFTSNFCFCSIIGILIITLGFAVAFIFGTIFLTIFSIPIVFKLMRHM